MGQAAIGQRPLPRRSRRPTAVLLGVTVPAMHGFTVTDRSLTRCGCSGGGLVRSCAAGSVVMGVTGASAGFWDAAGAGVGSCPPGVSWAWRGLAGLAGVVTAPAARP